MLVGRTRELGELAALLEEARDSRSSSLMIHGEAGIGKSALLDETVASADGFRVLRARGYESESDIAYAGLLDLLMPVFDLADRIPAAQAAALRGALAIDDPTPAAPFAVPAAVLSLLSLAAEEQPLLVVADDVHWLDAASLDALLFVARRLSAEGVVLLLSARDGEGLDPEALGLPRLTVGGLDADSARALLTDRTAGLPGPVAERLLDTAAGNPLALIEIPSALTTAQRTGREPLPAPLPVGTSVESAFHRRIADIAPQARRALVVISAMETNRVDLLHAALDHLGIPRDALREAEDAELVRYDAGRIDLRHPLLRAAIYHGATPPERRAAHEALAVVAPDPRRRAWHMAIAAVAPDESVAEALEAAGHDARGRGAAAAAASAFARAAELSVDEARRARRELEAALDFTIAGQFERALSLIDAALPRAGDDPILLADLRRARGHVELRRGAPQRAFELLEAEARRVAPDDPIRAALTLLEASVAHMMTGDMQALEETARRALALAEGKLPPLELAATLIIGETLIALGRTEEGDAMIEQARPLLLEGDPLSGLPEIIGMAGQCSVWIEKFDRAEAVLDRLVHAAREASAVGVLIYPLAAHSHLDFRRGRWQAAYADAAESVELARETGQIGLLAHSLTALARVESATGRHEAAQAHARESVELCRALGSDAVRVYGLSALAFDELVSGRIESAVELLDEAHDIAERLRMDEPGLVQWAPDHVEALARAGQAERAQASLDRFARHAEATQRRWALAATERCRGLLAEPDASAAHFERALVLHEGDQQPFERARTQLAFAERLRRARRRADARPHLTAALETFEKLGARPWAQRARDELEATGGPTGPRAETTGSDDLTSGELKIALLVAQGLTNREVAAALFLSPKTVEHHLSSIYRKLDVRSRTQLARLFAEERAPAAVA